MNRAYGNVPKEFPLLFSKVFDDIIPTPRGIKYWCIRFIRWFTRSRSKLDS
jgi:hypothetical protein